MRLKILNLYAGIGGNRTLWGNKHNIVAVEQDKRIAKIYKERFPEDNIILGDAHAYLVKHFEEFDVIWTSPPCITHSRLNIPRLGRKGIEKNAISPRYADMALYQEILLLQTFHLPNQKYIVENTFPYYQPLIRPTQRIGRHLIWSNVRFNVDIADGRYGKDKDDVKKMQKALGIHLEKREEFDNIKWRQLFRNCFDPKVAGQMLEQVVEKFEIKPRGFLL
jgi:DNA (cytosine-5)-methyltransferase 1